MQPKRDMSEWRRHPAMARGWPSFSPRAWRKSSQWFAVTRQHARLFLEDTVVDAVFRRVCYDRGWDDELKGCGAAPARPCIAGYWHRARSSLAGPA